MRSQSDLSSGHPEEDHTGQYFNGEGEDLVAVGRKGVRLGAAAFTLGLGLAAAETVGVANADVAGSSSASGTGSHSSAAGPKRPTARGVQRSAPKAARGTASGTVGRAGSVTKPIAAGRAKVAPAVVRQDLGSAERRLSGSPANPVTDFLEGSLLLLRRATATDLTPGSEATDAAATAAPPAPVPPTITMHNNSGQTIWVYNLTTSGDYSIPSDFQPVEIQNGDTAPVVLTLGTGSPGSPKNRIYIVEGASGFTLPVTATSGVDAFNPTATSAGDSFANYNFLEYYYYPSADSYEYTFDTSYIDEWSMPIQLQFHTNGADWSGAVDGQTYGFKNYNTVVSQLQAAGAPYGDLVWSGGTPWDPQPPATVSRIIGPDKVWTAQSLQPASNVNMNNVGWVPTSYQNFVQYGAYTDQRTKQLVYPYAQNGTQYSASGNFNFWKNSVTGPSTTPYPVALHTAAMHDGFPADANGVYGFFTYPNDEAAGQFTNIPQAVSMDIYVWGTGDGVSASQGGQWLYTAPTNIVDRLQPCKDPITGTGASDTFFTNSLFLGKAQTPQVAAKGAENDIIVIAPPKGATSHVVDVVDKARFGLNANYSSQFVYDQSTGYLYYDKYPGLPGYTAILANLSPSSIDPTKAIFVL